MAASTRSTNTRKRPTTLIPICSWDSRLAELHCSVCSTLFLFFSLNKPCFFHGARSIRELIFFSCESRGYVLCIGLLPRAHGVITEMRRCGTLLEMYEYIHEMGFTFLCISYHIRVNYRQYSKYPKVCHPWIVYRVVAPKKVSKWVAHRPRESAEPSQRSGRVTSNLQSIVGLAQKSESKYQREGTNPL